KNSAKGNNSTITVIGLDLGTTFCSVGVFHPGSGEVEVIADEEGRKSIPSAVSFTNTAVLAGHEAVDLADTNPQNTIYDAKRFIGKIFEPEVLETESARYPFKVGHPGAEFVISTNHTFTVSPEFIGSRLLLKMRKMAERQLGVLVNKAVISVPAEFDERQRNYTVRAANLAGLEVLRVINEPTAAAMAYGLHKVDVFNVLVVDLGGGTLDVSLLNKQGGMFLTRAMAGNVVTIRVPLHLHTLDSSEGSTPPVLFQAVITRKLFEELNEDLFQKILAPVETVLAEGHLEKEEVDEIVLVGGSTRIPRIRRLIREYFGKDPNTSVDPDLAVVTGVAIQAGIMGGSWPLQVSALEIPNRHLRKTNFS
uniref:Heat shock protein 70 family, member 13 n=1 Tax=Amphilophus citrinellus TaxID=61819 RepID=A0A3Q0ST18_AMPCI